MRLTPQFTKKSNDDHDKDQPKLELETIRDLDVTEEQADNVRGQSIYNTMSR